MTATSLITTAVIISIALDIANAQAMRLIGTSIYEELPDFHTYQCRFKVDVKCLWRLDGTLQVSSLNYKYVSSNISYTKDCSIEADKSESKKLPNDVKCVGIVDSKLIAAVNDATTELMCRSKDKINCTWTKDDMPVKIQQRYKYITNDTNTGDCSIRINQVKHTDYGIWICLRKTDHSHMNTEEIQSIYQLTYTPDSFSTSNKTITVTSYHKVTDVPNTVVTPETQSTTQKVIEGTPNIINVYTVLGCVGIVAVIAIAVGVLLYLRKVIQIKREAIQNRSCNETTNHVCGLSPRPVSELQSRYSDNPIRNHNYINVPVDRQLEDDDGYQIPISITHKAKYRFNKPNSNSEGRESPDLSIHTYESIHDSQLNMRFHSVCSEQNV